MKGFFDTFKIIDKFYSKYDFWLTVSRNGISFSFLIDKLMTEEFEKLWKTI